MSSWGILGVVSEGCLVTHSSSASGAFTVWREEGDGGESVVVPIFSCSFSISVVDLARPEPTSFAGEVPVEEEMGATAGCLRKV